MFKIAVIDDDTYILSLVKESIESMWNYAVEIEITTFTNAESALRRLEFCGEYEFDLILLDIELPKMSGIDLGEIIRSRWSRIYLVFLTSHTEFAINSYTIDAYQYILKEDMHQRLPIILEQIRVKLKLESKEYRLIHIYSDIQRIYYKDIIYFYKSKASKYVQYITVNGEYRERITLNEVLKEIDSKEFILVERGYVVNIKHIVGTKGNIIHLDNNNKLIVSRARIAKVKEQINKYWRDF